MLPGLAHIDAWIFDLDNTLYPAASDLFGLIDKRMTGYIARLTGLPREEAYRLQKSYFHKYGTTLSGLMAEHGIDPHEFLNDVHAIEMDVLREDRRLVNAIARLPGRKLIFTNGDAPYAQRVLARVGLSQSFEGIHDIHAMAYQPKPNPQAYQTMIQAFALDPARSLFADDLARNLRPAKALGLTTLWIDNGSEQVGEDSRAGIDYRASDLGQWLEDVMGKE